MPPLYICFLENDQSLMEKHWLNQMAAYLAPVSKNKPKIVKGTSFLSWVYKDGKTDQWFALPKIKKAKKTDNVIHNVYTTSHNITQCLRQVKRLHNVPPNATHNIIHSVLRWTFKS